MYYKYNCFNDYRICLLLYIYNNSLKINNNPIAVINMDWGLGIGDWGLGIGDWGLGPIPNPQSPKKIRFNWNNSFIFISLPFHFLYLFIFNCKYLLFYLSYYFDII